MKGWIKLHRELTEKSIWLESTPEQKVILVTLLTMANHKQKEWEFKGERFKAEPGQFITSLPKIAEKSGKGITVQNVRTALKRFEKYDFLTDKSTNKNRLITIVNWAFYQDEDKEPNREPNRQLTGNQQAANRQLTPNKNDKNDKNEKNEKKTTSGHHLENDETEDLNDNQNPFVMYQECYGKFPTPMIIEEIKYYLDEQGMEEPLIAYAIYIASKNGSAFSYANAILKRWEDQKIKTYEQAVEAEKKYKSKKRNRQPQNQSTEVIPEWFDGQEEKQHEQPEQVDQNYDPNAIAERIKRFRKDNPKPEE